MADKKISALTTLTQADVAATADFLPIVDTSATETKKVTPEALVLAAVTNKTIELDKAKARIPGQRQAVGS